MEYNNWILKQYKSFVIPVFQDFEPYFGDFLRSKGVHVFRDLSMSETFIDWSKYLSQYSFWYYYEGCEEAITKRLMKTNLVNHEYVIMDFGTGNPVCKIPTSIFIGNWLDFVIGADYLSTVCSLDGTLIMEFTKGEILKSNFPIVDIKNK